MERLTVRKVVSWQIDVVRRLEEVVEEGEEMVEDAMAAVPVPVGDAILKFGE